LIKKAVIISKVGNIFKYIYVKYELVYNFINIMQQYFNVSSLIYSNIFMLDMNYYITL